MTAVNRFNLVDEPWIPVVGGGLVSLKQLFSNSTYQELGGNPLQKISLMKLLLAIAQAAYTPVDDQDWRALGAEMMAKKCVSYLESWHGSFWLYGDKPFLQMPAIKSAAIQDFGAVLPEIASGNTTLLTQWQIEKNLTDADKAMLIVCLMGFGLGGKKTDNTISLSEGYVKKATGKPGTHVGYLGYLHSFFVNGSFLGTLWLNLFTKEQVDNLRYPDGIGSPPWEQMPKGEECCIANMLKGSFIGRLVPLSRFCLLSENGLHYSDGIAHLSYKEGGIDPMIAINHSKKEPKTLWVDPMKRPWRSLTSLLSFISQSNNNAQFDCRQISGGLARARENSHIIGIWSGGLKVSSNAGEQYVSGGDDFVESKIELLCKWFSDPDAWFERFKMEMEQLESLSNILYKSTWAYFKSQNSDGSRRAEVAVNSFWQLCEIDFGI